MLVTRINEKKAELENLKQLRDLSGGLAAQMQALEEKLSTLSEGTEGWACHVDDTCRSLTIGLRQLWQLFSPTGTMFFERSIWHQVGTPMTRSSSCHTDLGKVKIPKPSSPEDEEKTVDKPEIPLPQTLVRIPIEPKSEVLQSQNGTGKSSEE